MRAPEGAAVPPSTWRWSGNEKLGQKPQEQWIEIWETKPGFCGEDQWQTELKNPV